jgi:hypothetical protein
MLNKCIDESPNYTVGPVCAAPCRSIRALTLVGGDEMLREDGLVETFGSIRENVMYKICVKQTER